MESEALPFEKATGAHASKGVPAAAAKTPVRKWKSPSPRLSPFVTPLGTSDFQSPSTIIVPDVDDEQP